MSVSDDPKEGVTRFYFYALRDDLPLAEDWLVTARELRHGGGFREFRTGFLRMTGRDTGLGMAMAALSCAVERVSGKSGSATDSAPIPDDERPFFVGVVAAPVEN